MKSLFIVGTDTDVGKTFINGLFTYKLKDSNVISYKPVQSGCMENGKFYICDVEFVNKLCKFNDEKKKDMNTYALGEAVSPHLAAEMDDVKICKEKIIEEYGKLKNKYDYVVVEGAGGCIVPIIRDEYYMCDLIRDLNISVVVVASTKVGSINHTLLTIEYLKSKNIKINGIVFNGYSNNFYEDDNIKIILKNSKIDNYLVVDKLESLDIDDIKVYFDKIQKQDIEKFF